MTNSAELALAEPPTTAAAMTMLRRQVPLSLLCDLSDPDGPMSAEIFAEEGAPEQRWWEPFRA
jgi:hypothetical protein